MVQGGGFEPGMKQKPTDAPIENEANNGLKNDNYTVAMARTSAPHSATRAVLHQRRRQRLPQLQVARRRRAGATRCSARSSAGTDVVDAIERRADRPQGLPRRRAARRRGDHSAPSSSERLGRQRWPTRPPGAAGLRRAARAADAGGRSTSSPTCTCSRARRAPSTPGARTCAHTRGRCGVHPRRPVRGLGRRRRAPSAASRRAAPTCCARPRSGARSASWPATATSWSATRCSTRLRRACACPTRRVLVAFGERRAADARRRAVPGDADYQRFRAQVRSPALAARVPRPAAGRAARDRRARMRDASAGAQAQRGRSDWADVDADAALRAGCARPSAPTLVHGHTHRAGAATRSRPASCATC